MGLLLGLVGPWGIGQFYLGQTRRAFLWLLVPSAFFTLCVVGIHWLGATFGYGLTAGLLFIGVPAVWLASLVDARFVPEARLRRTAGSKVFRYWVVGVVFLVGVRFSVRALYLEAFKIPSGAMQPALLVGDHIMADKLVLRFRKPKRGEAIIFKFPEHPEQDFVKRVIATAGDELVVKNGHAWLNGWEVPHCRVGRTRMPGLEGASSSGELYVEYLGGEAYLTFLDERATLGDVQGPYVVPEDEVWVLGDNRNNSHDSRFWFGGRGGGVPLDNVKARALFRWLSLSDAGIDWSRFGTAMAEPLLPRSMKALQADLDRCLSQRPSPEKTLPPSAR